MAQIPKFRIIELFNQGLKYEEIAKQLRCSKSTVSYYCSDFKKKHSKYTPEKVITYQEYYDSGFTLKETAKNFGISPKSLSKRLNLRKLTKLQSKQRKQKHVTNYRVEVKKKCIDYKGGKCVICGYNKYQGSLDFHHIGEKDYNISGGTKSFESMKPELDKCILVCRNCHSEIHAGLHSDKNFV